MIVKSSKSKNRSTANPSSKSIRVLAVDDSSLVIDLIRFALRKFPIEVISLSRADNALTLLEEDPVSLIITDLKMPGMSGLDFLSRVRSLPSHKKTPVLVLSGYEEKSYVQAAMDAGATDFIAKPFTANQILDFVMKELRGGQTVN